MTTNCMNTLAKIVSAAVIVVVLATGALAIMRRQTPTNGTPTPSPATRQLITAVSYSCNKGETIEARYYRGTQPTPSVVPGEPPVMTGSVDVKLSDGRAFTLKQTISADGSRYANADESFVFWSKGDGVLIFQDNQERNFTGCALVADKLK